jgi:catechol 2,3-dioxygenase-like lactoylglutathione lyase family enzyme
MIKTVEHFSFTVSNLEAALQFFCERMGLEATPPAEVQSKKIQEIVGIPEACFRISLVRIPNASSIELIEYVRPKGRKIDSKPCNPGTAHLAFVVDNIQEMYQDLLQKDVKFVSPPVWLPGNDGKGRWGVCYLKGPDDITIELVEKSS